MNKYKKHFFMLDTDTSRNTGYYEINSYQVKLYVPERLKFQNATFEITIIDSDWISNSNLTSTNIITGINFINISREIKSP